MNYLVFLLSFFVSLSCKEIVTIYAVDRKTGNIVIDEQSEIGMTPASCMKVLTTGAALELLGENFSFTTTLEYDGEIKENVLNGNIYIRGGGDPCLGAKNWQHELESWAKAIKDLGIKEIKGKVVSDATAWERALAPAGWTWYDLGNYYGAGASALSFHENYYKLTLKPSKVGGAVSICSTFPPQYDLDFHNELITGPIGSGDQACIYGSEFTSTRFLCGSIPAGVEEFSIKGSIPNPALYLEKLFTKTLEKMEIVLKGETFLEGKSICFHKITSPTVADIVFETNQRSQNLYAEHLLKAIGKGSTEKGVKVLKNFWESLGVNLEGAQITDGSGLSRNNILSAKQCVEVLQKLQSLPHFETFFLSLPKVNGMNVKSGSMSLVTGYIGYFENLSFAFFIGQCPDWKKKKAITQDCFERLKTLYIK